MKKIKKIVKVLSIIFMSVFSILAVFSASFYYFVTKSVSIADADFENTDRHSTVISANGNTISPSTENYISINKLSKDTINAFISAEDRRFWTHSGVDFIRIGGAILSNIKSHTFSEGASTISQQLIKNTMLSNEKTITRKLKEIKLSLELEKKYDKKKILELYLNKIYFGNGCYGIENASNHYFSKSAKDLTLGESAMLAGTINAPSVYDIEMKPEKAEERRQLILKLMKNYGKISDEEYENAVLPITLSISNISKNNYIYNEIIKESCRILHITENEFGNGNYTIYSYIDSEIQDKIDSIIKNNYSDIESNPSILSILTDNETGGIIAVSGSKSMLNTKRPPGSTIKPLLSYGVAIENNTISPATILSDEKIDISGYSPENADKKYHGKISATEAIKNSYNIPAVKLLSEIGINNAMSFAKKLGIEFSDDDNNLALALGGMTEGVTPKQLADAYTAFANGGQFCPSTFIKKITKNHQTIYSNQNLKTRAMKDSTAYLISDMLMETSKNGTAKRLKNLPFQIASKTGTAGLPSSSKNSDAYSVSYTSKNTLVSYFGKTSMPENINGSTYPTMLSKDILEYIYSDKKPSDFSIPDSVKKVKLSKAEYEKGIIIQAEEDEPFFISFFAKNNLPPEKKAPANSLSAINKSGKKPILNFSLKENENFAIYRKNISNNSTKDGNIGNIIYDSKSNNSNSYSIRRLLTNIGEEKIVFEDKSAKSDEIYAYTIYFYDDLHSNSRYSDMIKLKCY